MFKNINKHILIFLLIFTSCSSNNNRSLAQLNPSFGPEIEFRGKKQIPSLLCAPTIFEWDRKKIILLQNSFLGASVAGGASAVGVNYLKNDDSKKEKIEKYQSWMLKTALGTAAAFAATWSYVKFCPEIRYFSDHAYYDDLREKIIASCPKSKCSYEEVKREVKFFDRPLKDIIVTYPDGLKISYTVDPNVLEVKVSPLDLDGINNAKKVIQRDIFKLLKSIGLEPEQIDGPWNSSHLHIGVRESFKDLKHLINFLKDQRAHPELQEGLLGHDILQAKPFNMPYEENNLEKLIDELDLDLKEHGNRNISRKHLDLLADYLPKNGHAIAFNSRFKTLELRYLRSIKNAHHFFTLAKLIKGRVLYLADIENITDWKGKKTPPKSEWSKIFKQYLSEAKMNRRDFRVLFPKNIESSSFCIRLLKTIINLTFR